MRSESLLLPPSPELSMPQGSKLLAEGTPAWVQRSLPVIGEASLRFVVRRHWATRLHTDFRLEACGRLLSWALDARLTLDPHRSIPAREMPDHDPHYLLSERRIPDGELGAGTTLVADYGAYGLLHAYSGSQEQAIVDALRAGRLDFWLDGVRLKGGFRLWRRGERWWLTKLQDEHASSSCRGLEDRSVLSGRTQSDFEREYQERHAGLCLPFLFENDVPTRVPR